MILLIIFGKESTHEGHYDRAGFWTVDVKDDQFLLR
jgi:hypothetical protein